MKYTKWRLNDFNVQGYGRPDVGMRGGVGGEGTLEVVAHQQLPAVHLGIGRVAASEREVPNMLVNMV
jgi:hypothetical protein